MSKNMVIYCVDAKQMQKIDYPFKILASASYQKICKHFTLAERALSQQKVV